MLLDGGEVMAALFVLEEILLRWKKSYQRTEQLMILIWVLFESFVMKQDV